jgi:ribosomal protein S18 acetylase RimI-like enzyme
MIGYKMNEVITKDQFVDLLTRTSLGARRPIDNDETMQGMVENSNLMITAWHNDVLIGVSRSMTDFHYACYLSDLAVDEQYQKQGIGTKLIKLTSGALSDTCKLLLVSAPAANEYYPKLGFEKVDRAWVLPRGKNIT